MVDIRIIDGNFAHAFCCSNGDLKVFPKNFRWYRGNENKDITVFTDGSCQHVHQVQSKVKVWMLLEPPTIVPGLYGLARSPIVQSVFDYILTFDAELAKTNPSKFILYPLGGCWIEEQDRKIYPKTKNVSLIASAKNMTEGHQLRHRLAQGLKDKIDLYGRAYKPIDSKLEALKDYRYTIVIENCKLDNYFSEKLIDPMVTGTIPIYWGTPNQKQFAGGAILDIKDLEDLIHGGTRHMEEFYSMMEPRIKQNFIIAQQYVNTEDWLWDNFFSKLCTTIQKQ